MPTTKDLLATVDALKAELDSLRPLKPDQEARILEKLRLEWNYHSNAIEGNQLTLGETKLLLMEGLTASGKPLKDYLDIKGHNHVIDYLVDFIHRKQHLTEADIREMHRLLLVESYQVTAVTPEGGQTSKWVQLGKYKTEPNQVQTTTGAVKRFTLPEETPAQMEQLMRWLREEEQKHELHPVAAAAIFHHRFVSIHPFDDGNGRMARLLMNLLLMQSQYPPVVIKIQQRNAYFTALSLADTGQLDAFISFIADSLAVSLDLYVRGAKGESIEDHDDIDKKITLLKQELTQFPEPKTLSPEVYRELATGALPLLFTKVLKKLGAFNDLYLSNQLLVHINGSATRAYTLADITQRLLGQGVPNQISLQFIWSSFKKAGLHTFDDTAELTIELFPLKYRTTWGKRRKNIERPYSAPLLEEDCLKIANELAEECYQTIQQQRAEAAKRR
jgi:Fic family protein